VERSSTRRKPFVSKAQPNKRLQPAAAALWQETGITPPRLNQALGNGSARTLKRVAVVAGTGGTDGETGCVFALVRSHRAPPASVVAQSRNIPQERPSRNSPTAPRATGASFRRREVGPVMRSSRRLTAGIYVNSSLLCQLLRRPSGGADLRYDATGKLCRPGARALFIFPHGATVDRDGTSGD